MACTPSWDSFTSSNSSPYSVCDYAKNLQTYRRTFERYHRIRIILDFKKAAIRAARESFSDAASKDALFTFHKLGIGCKLRKLLSRRTNPLFEESLECLRQLYTWR
ncbi:hypothetical protein RB195_005939 [Necator americanus]|uniref:Uncharacterized protein n=1 Tax=Necator americanus TaxID=51031 RepID=A0ABR1BS36_NECAM